MIEYARLYEADNEDTLTLLGARALPVTTWPTFLLWGAAYSIAYGVALWCIALTGDERRALAGRLHLRGGRDGRGD